MHNFGSPSDLIYNASQKSYLSMIDVLICSVAYINPSLAEASDIVNS